MKGKIGRRLKAVYLWSWGEEVSKFWLKITFSDFGALGALGAFASESDRLVTPLWEPPVHLWQVHLWQPPVRTTPVHMWQPPVKTGRHGWHWFYYVGIHQIRHGTEKISANIVKIYYIIILSDITESVLDMHSCYCGAPCGSYESVSLKNCQSLSACLLFQHHIKIAFTAPRAKSNPPSSEWNVNPSRYGQPAAAEWEVWL